MLGFASPLLLLALVAVPVLWFLLRAIPPAPIRRRFPGVALLLGLMDEDREADRTPWWLLALRMLAISAAIVAFAGPVLNPRPVAVGKAPLLIVLDGGWADAYDWQRRIAKATSLLDGAERTGRPVAVIQLADTPQPVDFKAAGDMRGKLATMAPRAWLPDDLTQWVPSLPKAPYDTDWITDGLSDGGRSDLVTQMVKAGAVTLYASDRPIYALDPAVQADGKLSVTARRYPAGPATSLNLAARGPDPSGTDRQLALAPLAFEDGAASAKAEFDLPPELRNRVTRFAIEGQRGAGAVSLAGDALKRRKVALVSDAADGEGLQLLSPLHYLRQALTPSADLIEGGVMDVVPAKPDVIVLADVAQIPQAESDALVDWVKKGGLLLRFAGPHLAAADTGRLADDPLMPVILRQGGVTTGGAMSWGAPKTLAPFPDTSPFHGLAIPSDLRVKTQVLAEPGPDLSDRTLAALDDGTPLVTRKVIGLGQVVLFHVTANAEWSDLPLSGLFVQMLERLAISASAGAGSVEGLTGLVWTPEHVLDGWGDLSDPGSLAGVPGDDLARALKSGPGPKAPPGLYRNDGRVVAVNAVPEGFALTKADWPADLKPQDLTLPAETALKGPVLSFALILLLLDILATLALSGRLRFRGASAALVALTLLAQPHPAQADAAADQRAIAATDGVVLAYVITGDPRVDEISAAGLQGLSDQLANRTAVEPLAPMGVDVAKDELAFFPFLYWPVTADAQVPSAETFAKLNRYLRTGGLILFDTRDADVALAGPTPEGQALQRIASGLDIPPLEPVPPDHVLTRSFYLLQAFPGRFSEGGLWVEAAPPDAAKAEGMPFRNLNDGVTPVVIGGNDWASAWAVDANGAPMFPVGRGAAGDNQREYAYRFGINLIMHVLTGNYKSDQVHVPALLERLGQ
ncbi:DUF4159 domain-containing protein [bacterium]|nr:DUF4159 domain-containing protein [bacterium]